MSIDSAACTARTSTGSGIWSDCSEARIGCVVSMSAKIGLSGFMMRSRKRSSGRSSAVIGASGAIDSTPSPSRTTGACTTSVGLVKVALKKSSRVVPVRPDRSTVNAGPSMSTSEPSMPLRRSAKPVGKSFTRATTFRLPLPGAKRPCASSSCAVCNEMSSGAAGVPSAPSEPVNFTLAPVPALDFSTSSFVPNASVGDPSAVTRQGSMRATRSMSAPGAKGWILPFASDGSVNALTVTDTCIGSQRKTTVPHCLASALLTESGSLAFNDPLVRASVPVAVREPCACSSIGSSDAFTPKLIPPAPPATLAAKERAPFVPTQSGSVSPWPSSPSARRMSTSSLCTPARQPVACGS